MQRGSPESKPARDIGTESDEAQRAGRHARADSPAPAGAGGVRQALFSRSLGLAMGGVFVLISPEFWSRTFQNWLSEFLAIASMAILSVWLRQRGSPESKPVGAAHSTTQVGG
ncbi:DUF6766 family protein [Streptomyces sp. MP131-18]|uniref:DUF6766 family protein n=1 Tax=Streptomyces sp. MP131-18 TaxID=1857892 RepID=UPI00097C8B24|nr:hypothetical protein STBA_20860 [Streptomyces sp. MP131-18]